MAGDEDRHEQLDAARVARRLGHLFEQVHPRSGPYSEEHVAAGATEEAGVEVGVEDVRRLRAGAGRVDVEQVAALARFFGVRFEYFVDDELAAQTDEQLDFVATVLRDAGLQWWTACDGLGGPMRPEDQRQALLTMARMRPEDQRQALLTMARMVIEQENGDRPGDGGGDEVEDTPLVGGQGSGGRWWRRR